MSKIRVYEYAKKHNVSSKDVIAKLKDMNIEVTNHMATIEDDTIIKLETIYNTNKPSQPQKTEKEQQSPQQGKQPASKQQATGQQTAKPTPQVVSKSKASAFEDDDKTSTPAKVKVVTAPKIRDAKTQGFQAKNKSNKGKSNFQNKGRQQSFQAPPQPKRKKSFQQRLPFMSL